MKRLDHTLLVGLLALVISQGSSFAQAISGPQGATVRQASMAERFDALRRERLVEIEAIGSASSDKQRNQQTATEKSNQKRELDARLKELQEKKGLTAEELDSRLKQMSKQKESLETQLKDIKAASSPDQGQIDTTTKQIGDLENVIAELNYAIGRTKEDEVAKSGLANQINLLESDISNANSLIRKDDEIMSAKAGDQQETEHKIALLLSQSEAENTFKSRMSTTFAALVGAVIIGFFVVALMDAGVRTSIFSHESGIQFITLFSLVIAIILFGIIGILEGKELAALLGGLSGYILGRGATARTTAS